MTISAQKPADGIAAMQKFDDAQYFKVPCECGCGKDIDLNIQLDDHGFISANISCITSTAYWRERIRVSYDEPWLLFNLKLLFNDWYNRIAIALTAIFCGYVETHTDIILNEQQATNMSHTMTTVIAELNQYIAKQNDKKI